MSVIIFAASGVGKSTFAKKAYGPFGLPVIDGDHVVASAGLWPKEKAWWCKGEAAAAVHRSHGALFARLLSRNVDLVVLFNTRIPDFVRGFDKSWPTGLDRPRFYAVVLPANVLTERWFARQEDIERGRTGHSPRPLSEHLNNNERIRVDAGAVCTTVYASLSEAAVDLGLHVKNDGGGGAGKPSAVKGGVA